jgi:5'(3')-deoxyribonucleotidase
MKDYKFYLDLDGVLADFEQHFIDISGENPQSYINKHGVVKFWVLIDIIHGLNFWKNLPIMEGAHKLMDKIKNYHYQILTSPSRNNISRVGKKIWVKEKTGSLFKNKPEICFKFKNQKKELWGPNSILIDDNIHIIKDWVGRGGIGIHHTDIDNTLSQLSSLGI